MKKVFFAALALAAVGLMVAPQLILSAPLEETMGLVQKIFYYHVPSAFADFFAIYLCGIASVVYLVKRSDRADAWAAAAGELAVLFGACTLATGMLWARKAWGVWWQWDARLTSFALCEMILVGYLLVRKFGGPGSRQLAAGLALFGCADVPIVYKSVALWRTIHPTTEVTRRLDPGMRPAYQVARLTILLVLVALFCVRLLFERNRARIDELYVEAAEAGLEE